MRDRSCGIHYGQLRREWIGRRRRGGIQNLPVERGHAATITLPTVERPYLGSTMMEPDLPVANARRRIPVRRDIDPRRLELTVDTEKVDRAKDPPAAGDLYVTATPALPFRRGLDIDSLPVDPPDRLQIRPDGFYTRVCQPCRFVGGGGACKNNPFIGVLLHPRA